MKKNLTIAGMSLPKNKKVMEIKITKIALDAEAEEFVFNELIKNFEDKKKEEIWGKGQYAEFMLNETVKCYSFLSLYHDKPEELDENHQAADPEVYPDMVGFILDFCIDGTEIEVERSVGDGVSIEDRIRNYKFTT